MKSCPVGFLMSLNYLPSFDGTSGVVFVIIVDVVFISVVVISVVFISVVVFVEIVVGLHCHSWNW